MKSRHIAHYFAEVLRDLYFGESSGVLEIENVMHEKVRLHFDRGMLYFAEGTTEGMSLAAVLGEAGALPETTLSQLNKACHSGIEIAARIVSGKILPIESLDPHIRAIVKRGVSRAFAWAGGSCDFQEEPPTSGFFRPDVLFTFECILEGIRSMVRFDSFRDVLLRLPGRVRLCRNTFLPVEKLTLRPGHGYVLSRVDGSMGMDEIALVLPPGTVDESLQFLYGLAVLGIIEFEPPVTEGLFSLRNVMPGQYEASVREEEEVALIRDMVAKLSSQSPAEMFGVDAGAPIEDVRRAFRRLKHDFGRAQFTDRVRKSMKSDLALIDKQLSLAFLKIQVERLEHDVATPRLDTHAPEINTENLAMRREMVKSQAQEAEAQNRQLSEKYFVKAREYFHEKDFFNVIEFCKLAIKFGMEAAPVYLLMAEAYAKNPNSKWQKMAEQAFTRACELDPWNAEYRLVLARFYEDQGLDFRARKQYEEALRIAPSHPTAQAGMRRRGRRS